MTTLRTNVLLRHIRGLAAAERASQLSDRQLLECFLGQRDDAAFETLVRRHGPMVFSVCRRILGNRDGIEDAFQATFLVLATKARSITNRESVGGWLHQVAANAALKARGRDATRRRHENSAPGRASPDPLDELTARELLVVLDEELRSLPEPSRTMLVLCYLEGRPRDEAARQLGWALGTFKRRLEQARRLLRERLVRRGVTLSAALLAKGLAHVTARAAVAEARTVANVRAALSGSVPSSAAIKLAQSVLPALGAGKAKTVAVCAVLSCALVLGIGVVGRVEPGQPVPVASAPRNRQEEKENREARAEEKPRAADATAPEMAGAAMAISGRVVAADGKAVALAEVAVVAWSHRLPHEGEGTPRPEVWAHAKADEQGRFQLSPRRKAGQGHYAQNHYQIAVLAGRQGHGIGWYFLKFDAGKADVTIALRPEQVRRGRVIDLNGQPAAGVRLDVVSVGKVAPKYEMVNRGFSPTEEQIPGYAGQPASGSGLWEEEVYFEAAPESLPCWPGAATTDAEGRFTLRGLGRDQTVRVRIHGNERVASEQHTFAPSPDAQPAETTFSCGSPFFIEGTVTDAETGKPITGARVHVEVSGAAISSGRWPVPADWKGRQDFAGPGFAPGCPPFLAAPSESGVTDKRGHYRISAFRHSFYKLRWFAVVVSGTDEQPYLTVKKTIHWPKLALKQQVDLTVPQGVLVRGRVVERPTGKPVAGARIDFWAKNVKARTQGFDLQPDGVLRALPRKADLDGKFQIVVPSGRSYLLVNGPTPDYALDSIPAGELGVEANEDEADWVFIPPGSRVGKKHTYYPDRLVTVDAKAGASLEPIKVDLRRAPVLKVGVVGPDGKPPANVRMLQGQAPFLEPSFGPFAREFPRRDGRFEVPFRKLDAPLCLVFLDAEHRLGAVASFTARQATSDPISVRLASCGSVSLRLLDATAKPLANYEPSLFLSSTTEPYSAPQDLEKLLRHKVLHWGYDAIWTAPGSLLPKDGRTRTDAQGRITMSGLIPGASYRLLLSDGKAKDFRVGSDKTTDLGDVTIAEPDKLREPKSESKK